MTVWGFFLVSVHGLLLLQRMGSWACGLQQLPLAEESLVLQGCAIFLRVTTEIERLNPVCFNKGHSAPSSWLLLNRGFFCGFAAAQKFLCPIFLASHPSRELILRVLPKYFCTSSSISGFTSWGNSPATP